ncbi:MAG: hypothetical protein PHQ89_00665 [Bacilli bacterium]|nr:hypothetical protein [Bacilli bacterium]
MDILEFIFNYLISQNIDERKALILTGLITVILFIGLYLFIASAVEMGTKKALKANNLTIKIKQS